MASQTHAWCSLIT